jgi:uncharacterized protein VirK/YbjX
MASPFPLSLSITAVTGFFGGVLLFNDQPLTALVWSVALVATGRWMGGRKLPDGPAAGRPPSLLQAAALGHPRGTPRWPQLRAKFLLRAAWQRRSTRAWLGRLAQPDARALLAARPRLSAKLQRPYVRRDWDVASRLAALTSHYDGLAELFSAGARALVYGDGLTLLRMNAGTAGRSLELKLAYRDQFEKEGELTLLLEDVASGLTLAGTTFGLFREHGERVVWIGGLQASPDPRMRGLIHDVTKELHGMRPKAFVIWCLRQLAPGWEARRIRAIADHDHIYRHWRKRRDFSAVYDEFWAECGGFRLPDLGWELPLVVPPRPREEIKPSRRKAHEQRYALLARLAPELIAGAAAAAR